VTTLWNMASERTGTSSGGLDTAPATSGDRARPAGGATSGPDRTGELVAGRYRIVRRLGQGGMGSVWLAVDGTLGREVALKELKDLYLPTLEVPCEDLTLQEARAAAAVFHPGVVQVYDLVVSGAREWIVMEALAGITLTRAILENGALPVETLVPLALRLLEALHAIHDNGVVHGDIKPCNVQLTAPGRPVLTDFGLASRSQDGERISHYAGSPPYMAPETIRTGVRSRASDLFALGGTLYAAAEGRRPFSEATPAGTAIAVLHKDPEIALRGAPLGRVIDGLLIKDPRQRLGLEDAYARLLAIESGLEG
jgi:serine/threonine protein kinase